MKDDAPEVIAAFADITPGRADVYLRLTPDREMTSDEFEKSWARRFSQVPDARVTFRSQTGGFSGRDITITLGGSIATRSGVSSRLSSSKRRREDSTQA